MVRIRMLSWPFRLRRYCSKWYVLIIFPILFFAAQAYQAASSPAPGDDLALVVVFTYLGSAVFAGIMASSKSLSGIGKSLGEMRRNRSPVLSELISHRGLWLLVILAPFIAIAAVAITYLAIIPLVPAAEPFTIYLICILLVVMQSTTGYLLFRRDVERGWAQALATGRPIVLYLRTFADDATLVTGSLQNSPLALADKLFGRIQSVERMIYRAVNVAGMTGVAVGAPGQRIPPLGFHRLYFDDATWQSEVSALIAKCDAVILNSAPTRWVAWELEEIVRQHSLAKLVLFTHASSAERRVENLNFALEKLGRGHRLAAAQDGCVIALARLQSTEAIAIEAFPDDTLAFMDATTIGLFAANPRTTEKM